MKRTLLFYITASLGLIVPAAALATTVQIQAGKDNSIFSDGTSNSGGAGYTLYTGTAGNTNTGRRRALVWFDVAAIVPAGATITSASLSMYVYDAATQDTNTARNTSLYDLTKTWGEGSSQGSGNHGIGAGTGTGAAAQTNDATWIVRFFNVANTNWTTAGGDFAGSPSATHAVGQASIVTPEVWQSAGMATDVQSWLDTPNQNFGWMVRGDESTTFTTRRFYSRDFVDNTNFPGQYFGPLLTVQFEVASPVPEPATWVLLMLGGPALMLLAGKRRIANVLR
ncbi:MAG: DNRLRE domain-containing protein [Planctomycetia bacterium]|nr:DNRLRE domain-containing protein [Planctomycetia bacterium]